MTTIDPARRPWRPSGKFLATLAAFLAIGIPPALAAEPIIGAWRSVRDESDKRQFWFAMLPQPMPPGTSFIAMDWKARKLVCCLAIRGNEVSEDNLRNKLHIPGPWVTDLTNDWNSEHRPYRPRIFALTPSADFLAHQFAGAVSFSIGGLLLPDDARLGPRGQLMIGEETYRVRFIETALGDGDGAIDTYTLRTVPGNRSFIVEVPYGTY